MVPVGGASLKSPPAPPPEAPAKPEHAKPAAKTDKLTLYTYLKSFKGRGTKAPKAPPLIDISASWMGAFLGILVIALIHYQGMLLRGAKGHIAGQDQQLYFVVGAFGASAALLFGAPQVPISQPWNVVVGHTCCAITGAVMHFAFRNVPNTQWLAAGLAVGLGIGSMMFFRAYHPPAGSTAFLAVIVAPSIKELGFFWIIMPVMTGAATISTVAVLWNNLQVRPSRSPYPLYWVPLTKAEKEALRRRMGGWFGRGKGPKGAHGGQAGKEMNGVVPSAV